jgi:hypothetical protein
MQETILSLSHLLLLRQSFQGVLQIQSESPSEWHSCVGDACPK